MSITFSGQVSGQPARRVRHEVRDGVAVIAAPGGDGRTGFVSRDDLADVAAAVLLRDHDDPAGRTLDVTGPEALTLAEAAAVLAEVTGRPAEYREQTVEQAWETRRPSGHRRKAGWLRYRGRRQNRRAAAAARRGVSR